MYTYFYVLVCNLFGMGFILATLVTLIAVQDILIIFKHFSSQDILIRDRTFSDFWKLWRKLFYSCRNSIRKGEKH